MLSWLSSLFGRKAELPRQKQRRLSHSEKLELFGLYATGNYTKSELSRRYGVTPSAIYKMLRRHNKC